MHDKAGDGQNVVVLSSVSRCTPSSKEDSSCLKLSMPYNFHDSAALVLAGIGIHPNSDAHPDRPPTLHISQVCTLYECTWLLRTGWSGSHAGPMLMPTS